MTDNEYASKIYCWVFGVAMDNGDTYTRGVLDAIGTLDERDRQALECFFRKGMTYEQTGVFIGNIRKEVVRSIISKAKLKLRHPHRANRMSVTKLIRQKEKQLEDAELTIAELHNRIGRLTYGNTIGSNISADFASRKKGIGEIGFSSRILNHLLAEGITTVEALTGLESLDILMARRGFGQKSQDEIVTKMRLHGYAEWADNLVR